MKKGLKRLLSLCLVLAMTVGLCGCGDEKVSADAALAKEYVYAYQELDIPELGNDVSYNAIMQYDNKVYLIANVFTYDEVTGNSGNQVKLVSMNMDGSDVQVVDMEQPVVDKEAVKTALEGNGADAPEAVEDAVVLPLEEEAVEWEVATSIDVDLDIAVEENLATEDVLVDNMIADDMAIGDEYYSQTYEHTSFNHHVFGNTGIIYAVRNYYYEDYVEGYQSYNENSVCAWDLQGKLLWNVPIENLETEESYSYVSKLIVNGDKGVTLLLSGDKAGKIEVDAQGNVAARKDLPKGEPLLSNMAGQIMVKEDGTLLIPHYDDTWTNMYMTEYNINTDTVGEETKLPDFFMWSGYNCMTSGINTDVLYSNSNGIFGYNIGDEQPTQIMSYINSDLNTTSINQFMMLDEEHFIGFYNDNVDYTPRGAIFTKRNPEDIPDKEVIVVAGLYMNYDLKNRVINFNKSNDKYRIVVKEYESFNTMEDNNAGNTQLNNDIITGNMPDILVANTELPIESYISKGLIADVGKLIEEDEELSKMEFLENVFNAYSVNGKLYYVVPNFYVRTYAGKTSFLGDRESWTIQEFRDFVASLPEGTTVMGDVTRDSFIYQLIQFCGNDFIDVSTGKCNFDSEEFIGMLEYAKTLPVEFSDDYYGEDYWMNYESQYREDRTVLMSMYISSFQELSYNINGYFGEDINFIGFPTNTGKGSILMESDSSYVLSAKSKNLEGAWEFIRYYLTDEYQSEMTWGLPVSKNAFMEKSKDAMQKRYWTDENGNKVEYDDYFYMNGEEFVLEPLNQEQLDQVIDAITSTEKKYYYNEDIQNIIIEEAAAFFEGQKSAAEVAQIIQSRAQIFVDENR